MLDAPNKPRDIAPGDGAFLQLALAKLYCAVEHDLHDPLFSGIIIPAAEDYCCTFSRCLPAVAAQFPSVVQAGYMFVAGWYGQREAVAAGSPFQVHPSIDMLLWQHRDMYEGGLCCDGCVNLLNTGTGGAGCPRWGVPASTPVARTTRVAG